ncbi:MAG: hypothetical protein K8Q99_06775 [Acholeplasmataceae bacterium]|nr:hypothetical protein [Acholeplasmataceae bacterium]
MSNFYKKTWLLIQSKDKKQLTEFLSKLFHRTYYEIENRKMFYEIIVKNHDITKNACFYHDGFISMMPIHAYGKIINHIKPRGLISRMVFDVHRYVKEKFKINASSNKEALSIFFKSYKVKEFDFKLPELFYQSKLFYSIIHLLLKEYYMAQHLSDRHFYMRSSMNQIQKELMGINQNQISKYYNLEYRVMKQLVI